jgi:hypothetical protein
MLSLPRYYLRLLVHARPLVSVAVSGDRHSVSYSPLGSARSGPDPNLLIRRSGRVVQKRPLRSVRWADIPQLSAQGERCPAAWQQCWQQQRHSGTDPRPSANGPSILGMLSAWPGRPAAAGMPLLGYLRLYDR